MRVLQLGSQEDFAAEALDRDAGEQFRREDLDYDPAIEGALEGDVRSRHAAAAELALDVVAARQIALEAEAKVVG
ncbi:hypothetical protein D3C83_138090 [compost metagenome]